MRRLVLAAAASLSLVYCVGEDPPGSSPAAPDASADVAPSPPADDGSAGSTDATAPARCPFVSWPGRVLLCEGFEAADFPAWDAQELAGAASLGLISDGAFAAPSALHVTSASLPPGAADQNVAWLKARLPRRTSARIDLELLVEPLAADAGGKEYRAMLAELTFRSVDGAGAAPPVLKVVLFRYANGDAHAGLATEASGVQTQSAARAPLPSAAYTHLTLTLAYEPEGLSARIAGESDVHEELDAEKLAAHDGDVTFALGVRAADDTLGGTSKGNTAWDFKIDNVSIVVDD